MFQFDYYFSHRRGGAWSTECWAMTYGDNDGYIKTECLKIKRNKYVYIIFKRNM